METKQINLSKTHSLRFTKYGGELALIPTLIPSRFGFKKEHRHYGPMHYSLKLLWLGISLGVTITVK